MVVFFASVWETSSLFHYLISNVLHCPEFLKVIFGFPLVLVESTEHRMLRKLRTGYPRKMGNMCILIVIISRYEPKFVLKGIPQSWGTCMDLPTMVHGWETLLRSP